MEAPILALLKRGGCVFDKKVENAEAAGAVGVVIYNDREEELLRTIAVRKIMYKSYLYIQRHSVS